MATIPTTPNNRVLHLECAPQPSSRRLDSVDIPYNERQDALWPGPLPRDILSDVSQKKSLDLAQIPLFSGLPPKDYPRGRIRSYPKHAMVIQEGDPSSSLYVLINGTIKLCISDEKNEEVLLDIRSAGDYFGELEIVDHGPYVASAISLEPSQIYAIPQAEFERFLAEHPEIDHRFYCGLVQQIRPLTRRIKILALYKACGRIMHTLLAQ
jgi:CRP-like cAMP-binding protein